MGLIFHNNKKQPESGRFLPRKTSTIERFERYVISLLQCTFIAFRYWQQSCVIGLSNRYIICIITFCRLFCCTSCYTASRLQTSLVVDNTE